MGAARVRAVVVELTAMLIAGLALALFGPFGTFARAALPERLVYWCGLAVIGYFLYRPAVLFAEYAARRLNLPRLASWIAATLIASFPMTFIVWRASFSLTPNPVRVPNVGRYLETYSHVVLVAALLVALFLWIDQRAPTPAPIGPSKSDEPPPRLLERLPPSFGPDVLALEMEDHYVRVHGRQGSKLLLMRMRDAVAEMDGAEGAQVHRSWWVARDAVVEPLDDGRKLRLRLVNGIEAPVARNSVAALRDAGWFDGAAAPG